MNRMNILHNKKFRYGSMSIILTAVFIALVVIVNVIFTSLAGKYQWYIDMSPDEVYTISDASRELLSDIEAEVKIIFCMDPDKLEEIPAMRYIYTTAKEFQSEFDNIKIEHIDPVKNPSAVKKYKATSASAIDEYTVIVESGTEHRVLSYISFFKVRTSDGSIFAYDGEFKFTATILALTQTDSPIACFTQNHGETSNTAFYYLLEDAGYEVIAIDLTKEDIPEDCRLMIISNPTSDFITENDGSDISEIKKIDKFLDGFGSLMVFLSPDSNAYPDLEEYLEEWGVKFNRQIIKDSANSVTKDGYSLVATYTNSGYGASIHEDLRTLPEPPKTIVRYAMPIDMLYDENGDYFSNDITRNISPVLVSSEKAISEAGGKKVSSATELDRYNLMTLTYERTLIENDPYYSYVLACGSANFTDQVYIDSNTYANRDILYSALRSMGKEKVPANIDYKILNDYTIENITTAQATTWTWVLATVLPIIILAACAIVVIRRKHA